MLCTRFVLFAVFLVLAVAPAVQAVNEPTCDMVTSNTVDFMCPGNTTCPAKVPDKTIVHTTCKAGHIPTEDLQNMVCEGGRWNSIPTCKPDCGLLNPSEDAKTLPWNVGIYQIDNNETEQICGGTLINSNIVIGAAHCFFDYKGTSSPPDSYRVVIGKSVRTWNHEEEKDNPYIQKSEVSKIILHELYDGSFTNQQADVAILVLKTPFKLSDSVRPACYDLTDGDFYKNQMTPGNFGKVVGWGRTENDYDSVALRLLSLPVVGLKECREEMTKHRMRSFITLDKFCAGTLDAHALCQGDGGSGFVIPLEETTKSAPRYYLRGVVSTAPVDRKLFHCKGNTYTLFTNLYTLRDWLVENLSRLT